MVESASTLEALQLIREQGYLYGRQVLDVRKHYEQVVSEIRSDQSVCMLPLANELVTWPSPSGLCHPVFQERQCEAKHVEGPSSADHLAPPLDGPSSADHLAPPLDGPSSADHLAPPLDGPSSADHLAPPLDTASSPDSVPSALSSHLAPFLLLSERRREKEKCVSIKYGVTPDQGQDFLQNKEEIALPMDKESLLELRRKLAMELVWLRQAIVSRQKYLQLKEELET